MLASGTLVESLLRSRGDRTTRARRSQQTEHESTSKLHSIMSSGGSKKRGLSDLMASVEATAKKRQELEAAAMAASGAALHHMGGAAGDAGGTKLLSFRFVSFLFLFLFLLT